MSAPKRSSYVDSPISRSRSPLPEAIAQQPPRIPHSASGPIVASTPDTPRQTPAQHGFQPLQCRCLLQLTVPLSSCPSSCPSVRISATPTHIFCAPRCVQRQSPPPPLTNVWGDPVALDHKRKQSILQALNTHHLDAFASPYASEVLLLSGYWPVMNASVVLTASSGETTVLLPEDELDLARATSDAHLVPYKSTTLQAIRSNMEGFTGPLLEALHTIAPQRLGLLARENIEPASYIVGAEYRSSFWDLFEHHLPDLILIPADDLIEQLKAAKSPAELEQMRRAARIAAPAFEAAPSLLQPGRRESEVAADLQRLFESAPEARDAQRSYGYFFCMSGPNSATASAAFAHTRQRTLEDGDLVMIHANTCCDGLWTDITRTFTLGPPPPRHQDMRSAIAEARAAALAAIRPGVPAREVDGAARSVMASHGFGEAFRHATGHGVGFAAANSGSLPRIHPVSTDTLTEGMTFNIEPAAYFSGYGGMRHCDVVAVTASGAEVLTNF